MGRGWRAAVAIALTIGASACLGDDVPSPDPSPSAATSPGPTASPTPTAQPSPTPTTPAAAACDDRDVLAQVDAAIDAARLGPTAPWDQEVADSRFVRRTVTGEEFADRLGFDCGLRVGQAVGDDERLVVAAWTGPRMAWVVQTSEAPRTPYAPEATVTLLVDEADGEFLDGDTRALWAGTVDSGVSFVVGHVDFNLGAAAKGWVVDDVPPDPGDEEPDALAAEQHGREVLTAAGMREVEIAQPAELGSEEGYLQFVSPTGQISVADVAPTGWFDPLEPRYYTGETTIETIEGTAVRITEPGADAQHAVAAEVGFACDDFVWILEPPLNGDVDEMRATASAILATEACRR